MMQMTKALPRFAPDMTDKETISIWFNELGNLSHQEAVAVYHAALRKFDSFPSIRQVLELAGHGEPSNEDKGREVAERIWAAIDRFGSQYAETTHRHAEINASIGPIGVEVVRMSGGWNQLCAIATYDNATTIKAQWREMAAAVARKGAAGGAPPDFAKLPERARLALAKAGDVFGGGKP